MCEKVYHYKLPNENNEPIEQETKSNSVIIIGANGTGKSKLGAWIEEQDKDNIHRIGAQRSLNFDEFLQLMSFEEAENIVFYGDMNKNKNLKWNWKHQTTTLLQDFNPTLSALIAKNNIQVNEFAKKCKECEKKKIDYPKVPKTVTDDFIEIWDRIFSQRRINFDDSKVTAMLTKESSKIKELEEQSECEKDKIQESVISYSGTEMSDGERTVLYLIAQCLCIPENKTIIIDEPELHLHRSIMNVLWTEMEKKRNDCLFIYITHDTQFAANHSQAEKIWIKSYDGESWEWEKAIEGELPEQLLLDILGNRKNVLFVEGEKGKFDTKIYSEIYKDYYVVPCGSCENVIMQTRAMHRNPQLHHLKCYGLIDRDYKEDYEIEQYKKDDIYTLSVAEAENLLLTEEVLELVNGIQEFTDKTNIENVKKYVIDDRFKKEINRQICEATVSQIKFKCSTIPISNKSEEEAKTTLENEMQKIKFDTVKSEQENKFANVAAKRDYKEILKIYNCKSLVKSIGHFFELNDKCYIDFILRHLNGEKRKELTDAIRNYLPTEIPILITNTDEQL